MGLDDSLKCSTPALVQHKATSSSGAYLPCVQEAAAAGLVSKEALGDPLPRPGGRSAENHEKMGASRLRDSQQLPGRRAPAGALSQHVPTCPWARESRQAERDPAGKDHPGERRPLFLTATGSQELLPVRPPRPGLAHGLRDCQGQGPVIQPHPGHPPREHPPPLQPLS